LTFDTHSMCKTSSKTEVAALLIEAPYGRANGTPLGCSGLCQRYLVLLRYPKNRR